MQIATAAMKNPTFGAELDILDFRIVEELCKIVQVCIECNCAQLVQLAVCRMFQICTE